MVLCSCVLMYCVLFASAKIGAMLEDFCASLTSGIAIVVDFSTANIVSDVCFDR